MLTNINTTDMFKYKTVCARSDESCLLQNLFICYYFCFANVIIAQTTFDRSSFSSPEDRHSAERSYASPATNIRFELWDHVLTPVSSQSILHKNEQNKNTSGNLDFCRLNADFKLGQYLGCDWPISVWSDRLLVHVLHHHQPYNKCCLNSALLAHCSYFIFLIWCVENVTSLRLSFINIMRKALYERIFARAKGSVWKHLHNILCQCASLVFL